MKNIIIDTNIFVSYLISNTGYSYKIVNGLFLEKKFVHFVSEKTVNEYFNTFAKTRFSKKYPSFAEKAYQLLESILLLSKHLSPPHHFNILTDGDDNYFLDIAYECKADYLITGNTNHFTISKFYQTEIITPRRFWEEFKDK